MGDSGFNFQYWKNGGVGRDSMGRKTEGQDEWETLNLFIWSSFSDTKADEQWWNQDSKQKPNLYLHTTFLKITLMFNYLILSDYVRWDTQT